MRFILFCGKTSLMIVMGLESSTDETGVALVDDSGAILSNLVYSQLDEHALYGGVVPEIAARAHLSRIDGMVAKALKESGAGWADIDGIAATCGPGLIGGVMVGMMTGKALAAAHAKPFLAINHLEGHVLTPRMAPGEGAAPDFPYLVLLVSGGHTQILIAHDIGVYERLGTTLDDALGEAFDKCAKLLGLPYPGGPELEKLAGECANLEKALTDFPLPVPMVGRDDCNFSFSGLKTALRARVDKLPEGQIKRQDGAALAAAFQHSVTRILEDRCRRAISAFKAQYPDRPRPHLIVCGGVSANRAVRHRLEDVCADTGMHFAAPPLKLCADNGAMIAWAGVERLRLDDRSPLDFAARPRWPLDEMERPGPAGRPG